MRNVLILGAGGQIARLVIGLLSAQKDMRLTLFLRDAAKME
jgi:saccharopine dehydrogenase-like NADP-dependent oxidoreductase